MDEARPTARATSWPMLAHSLVVAPSARPNATIALLHGILGMGSNWRSFARRIIQDRPRWAALLVDLRNHGLSRRTFPGPQSIDAASRDLLALPPPNLPPMRALLGHSFGGKVALLHARLRAMAHVWVIDAPPGARSSDPEKDGTFAVLAMLEHLPRTFSSRRAFTERVEHDGHSAAIAQWLAMNLVTRGTELELALDLPAIRAMLEDYLRTDAWAVLEAPPVGTTFHVVLGGASHAFSPADRARIEALASRRGGRITLDIIPNASHWVHVDAPDALASIVLRDLPLEPPTAV